MGWKGRPASGARRASIPSRLPIQWTSSPERLRVAATASPALVWPPVPPPAMTTRTGSARLEGEVDQARDQLRVGNARGFPELGVGAGRGEAGQGVDLVDEHVRLALDEEIHAGQSRAVDGAEGFDGELAHTPGDVGGQRCGHLEGRVASPVLRLVVVPLAGIADLAGDRGLRVIVAEHGDLDLAPLHGPLDEETAIVRGGQGEGGGQLLGPLDLADAHARAEVRGLDET